MRVVRHGIICMGGCWLLLTVWSDLHYLHQKRKEILIQHGPCSTWKTIELSLIPYKARLGGRAKKYQDVIDKAMCLFDPAEDFTSDKPLSGEFLLGYHCQREALKSKKDEPKSFEDDNLAEE